MVRKLRTGGKLLRVLGAVAGGTKDILEEAGKRKRGREIRELLSGSDDSILRDIAPFLSETGELDALGQLVGKLGLSRREAESGLLKEAAKGKATAERFIQETQFEFGLKKQQQLEKEKRKAELEAELEAIKFAADPEATLKLIIQSVPGVLGESAKETKKRALKFAEAQPEAVRELVDRRVRSIKASKVDIPRVELAPGFGGRPSLTAEGARVLPLPRVAQPGFLEDATFQSQPLQPISPAQPNLRDVVQGSLLR